MRSMNYVHHGAFKKLLGDWPAESLYRITVHTVNSSLNSAYNYCSVVSRNVPPKALRDITPQ